MQKHRGFTLVELLVVTLVIGILVAIAVPQYYKLTQKAQIQEVVSFAKTVSDSEDRYEAQHGSYWSGGPGSCTLDICGAGGWFNMAPFKYFNMNSVVYSDPGKYRYILLSPLNPGTVWGTFQINAGAEDGTGSLAYHYLIVQNCSDPCACPTWIDQWDSGFNYGAISGANCTSN